jgi:PAS domain S-box-containing protein
VLTPDDSRLRLAELFMQSPTAVLVMTGPEHRLDIVNPPFVRLLRRTDAADLLGRPIREALPEVDGQGFFELLDAVYATGEAYVGKEVLCRLISVDGTLQDGYFDVVCQAIHSENGSSVGLMAQATDVTEYVQSRERSRVREEALRREWDELAEMYRTAPVGFAMYEPVEFRMIHVNEKFTQMLNMTAEQLMGRSVLDFAVGVDGLRERYERVAAGERVENIVVEGELHSQPGTFRSWLVNYTPIFGEGGRVQAISTVALDVTAQRRAEKALIQSEKLAAVGRLASSIAHEINNPLESVTNLLYLALHQSSDPEQLRFLDLADQELRRVSIIANQTLRFHKQLSRPTEIGCESLFTTVLNIYEGRLRNSGVAVESKKCSNDVVLCFEGEIRQVLTNLVGNSIDAMPHGGRLLVRSRTGTDWRTGRRGMVLTVADTGSGMSATTRARVFEAFFTTKGISGTGLGLWISLEIVQRHDGRILMRSSQRAGHHGTVTSLFLPFDRAKQIAPQSVRQDETLAAV